MQRALGLLLVFSTFMFAGCSTLNNPVAERKGAPPEPAETYAERKQKAITGFERQRDAAQVQAAIDCWGRGEVPKCQAMLMAIINRNPSDANARLRLAEVLIAQEDAAAAEAQLRECLQLAPQSAEAHHTLGMLLSELPGREREATPLLQRAHELDPANEAYAATAL